MFRWIAHLRRRGETPGQTAATEALRLAQEARDETARRTPEVAQITGSLRRFRERNHFAELIDEALRGGG